MKRLLMTSVAVALFATPVMAQYVTTPSIYGHPEYGTTTSGPGGVFVTTPNIYGHPEYGSTTTGPNGTSCHSSPNIYGQPQYGFTTTC